MPAGVQTSDRREQEVHDSVITSLKLKISDKTRSQQCHFTEKRYLVGNSSQICNPLHRKIGLHRKWHPYLHSALLNLCVYGKINMF